MGLRVLSALVILMCLGFLVSPGKAQDDTDLKLYTLDCGAIEIADARVLDMTNSISGSLQLKSACYLIQHGNEYMLWEAGFNPEAIKASKEGDMFRQSITETITQSLEKIGLKPSDITKIGVSSMHFDNIGQANDFKDAMLYMGAADYDFLFDQSQVPQGYNPEFLDEWGDGENVVKVNAQTDVFGDGRVVIVPTAGHTKGHTSLLVNLKNSGSYLLVGDLWHTQDNYDNNRVASFVMDANQTLQTMTRVKSWAQQNNVKTVIQHEPKHFEKMPTLPEYLD